jgi:hypothetical protein
LSVNFPEYRVPFILKKSLVKMFNTNKKTTQIFRAFLNTVYENKFLGNNNADTLLDKEKNALDAFRGEFFTKNLPR